MSGVELLPCPFCGGSNFNRFRVAYITCDNCDLFGPTATDDMDAAAAWNTRAPSAVNDDLLAALEYCAREDGTHPANKVAVAKDAIAKARGLK